MSDKLVTHDDLDALRGIRHAATSIDSWCPEGEVTPGPLALLDRLIAAAEADQPPLPEGWVIRKHGAVHYHRAGVLYSNADCTQVTWQEHDVERELREGSLTPLRPTVTEADVERAARVAWDAMHRHATWEALPHGYQAALIRTQRAAFGAAGIEVQP